jgi:WD40 repeat protein
MKTILGHVSFKEQNDTYSPIPVYNLCYSRNGNLVFTGDDRGLIKVWSTHTGALVDIFKFHSDPINDILFIGDNYLLSCSDDKNVVVWDVNALQLVQVYSFSECISALICY